MRTKFTTDTSGIPRALGRVSVRQEMVAPAEEVLLMIALADFGSTARGTAGNHIGSQDAPVAYCSRLRRNPDFELPNGAGRMTYFREDGAAIPVWAPTAAGPLASSEAPGCSGYDTGCGCGSIQITCGTRLWAKYNLHSKRYEVVAHQPPIYGRGNGNEGGCECSWFGYAVWRIADSGGGTPAWELVENRCSGCYDDTPGVGTLDAFSDLRFTQLGLNESWIEEPAPAASGFAAYMDTDWRYVTCCGVTDVEDDPPECEDVCCYSIQVPIPQCENESISTMQLVLNSENTNPCAWSVSGGPRDAMHESGIDCPPGPGEYDGSRDVRWVWLGAAMSGTTLTLAGKLIYRATDGSTVNRFFLGTYTLNAAPDCTTDLTATKGSVSGLSDAPLAACASCYMDSDKVDSLFPESLTVTLAAACDTTTTNTTGTSTSSTTASTTTTTTTTTTTESTTTTTTESTTTSSTTSTTTTSESTTTSSTGSTTTTTTTTTAEPCSGSCNYVGDGAGGWTYTDDNCTVNCNACVTDSPTIVAQFGASEGVEDTLVIPCDLEWP